MLRAAEERLVFIYPFILGVGYWVGARGMHVIPLLDALLKGKEQFWMGHKFPCLGWSLPAPVLST